MDNGRDGSKTPRPPSRAATTQLDDLGPPLSGSLEQRSGTTCGKRLVLGMSRQPPQARARKKVQGSKRKVGASGCGCWVGASGSSCGVFLSRAAALGPITTPPRQGTEGSEIARPCRGGEDALTCSSVADARAYLARPPRLQSSPGQPPPPVWHHVQQGSQSRGATCAEHPGRKGGAWEATLRSLQASEIKLGFVERWRLRMSRCRAK